MNRSEVSMSATDPATTVADYEALRASFLASRASPAMRSRIRRVVAEGLHAWLASQPSTHVSQVRRAPAAYSVPISADLPDNGDLPNHDDLVQLMACMTLRSLNFSAEAA